MKIAFFVGGFPFTSQTFVLNQVTGLLDLGHDVRILSRRISNTPDEGHEDLVRYRLRSRTESWPTSRREFTAHAVRLFRDSRGRRFEAFKVLGRFLRTDRSVRVSGVVGRALVCLRHEPFDAIVCHFGPRALECLQLRDAGALSGPIATFFHGYDLSRHVDTYGTHVYDSLFSRGDIMLPISNHWQKKLIALGCKPEKTKVHRMGIDCSRFSYRERTLARNEPVRFLGIGRMVEKKGFNDAVSAFASALKVNANLELHLVGDGPLLVNLQASAKQLGIESKVYFHGWLSQESIIELQRITHIFLAPSVTASDGDQEGIPVGLIEAMASGMPVISTRHTGIPELVENGESGFLVEERDSTGLSSYMVTLANAPALWTRMGRCGRQRVEESFDINRLNNDLETTLKSLRL